MKNSKLYKHLINYYKNAGCPLLGSKPFTTYQKVGIIMGELAFLALPIWMFIQTWKEFLNNERGFISTNLLSILSIWLLCGLLDIHFEIYGSKEKKKRS